MENPRVHGIGRTMLVPLVCVAVLAMPCSPALARDVGKETGTVILPRHDKLDVSGFPYHLGVLGNHLFMHPTDVGGWRHKIDSRHQLFIDDYLVAEMSDLQREFHQVTKHPDNPILRPDKPWEQARDKGFGVDLSNILRDPRSGKYQMWYNVWRFAKNVRDKNDPWNPHFYRPMCYATSSDGVRWTKPPVGVYKFKEYGD